MSGPARETGRRDSYQVIQIGNDKGTDGHGGAVIRVRISEQAQATGATTPHTGRRAQQG